MACKKLNNGKELPVIGFGTWQLTDEEKLLNVLEAAYSIGYRHFDTAPIYENQTKIAKFIAEKDRKDLFITSKLWNTEHNDPSAALNKTLKELDISYLDMYLIHFPVNLNGEFNLEKLWRHMESFVKEGKVKSIGVANFGMKNLKKLLSFCEIKPVVDQIELHPYLPQKEIKEFCDKNDIVVISYSSLGSTKADLPLVREDPVIKKIAEKHNTTPSKVLLSYPITLGCCVIPRSSSKEHVKDNFECFNLDKEDIEMIDGIKTRCRYVNVEEFGPHRFD